MFQISITLVHSAGVMHCAIVCACWPMLVDKWGRRGNRKCAPVFWVCLPCGSSLSLSQGNVGLWVLLLFSSPLYSVSPPSPGSNSTPAPCSRHGAGQGFLSNWRQREDFRWSLFLSLDTPLLSLWLSPPIPNHSRGNRNDLCPKVFSVCTQVGFIGFFPLMPRASVNV